MDPTESHWNPVGIPLESPWKVLADFLEINGKPKLACMTRMNEFEEEQTVVITPLKSFPVIKDIVSDVSWNYKQNEKIIPFSPSKKDKEKDFVMMQKDIDRVQHFRKCIECYLWQNVCHVIRDNDIKKNFSFLKKILFFITFKYFFVPFDVILVSLL